MKPTTAPTHDQIRAAYAETAFARMGIAFEAAMAKAGVRIAVEGAAAAKRRGEMEPARAAA